MEEMFDVIASGNLETMRAWESVRQSVHRDHTPEEQVEMDRRVLHSISGGEVQTAEDSLWCGHTSLNQNSQS
ncbi:hypothetical protein YC2023_090163 [Brassica napus]